MKKIFAVIAIALLLIPSVCMAKELGATGRVVGSSVQGIMKVFYIRGDATGSSTTGRVVDGDTFTGPATPKSFWAEYITSGSTAVYGHTRESSGTYTFELSSTIDIIYLYVVE